MSIGGYKPIREEPEPLFYRDPSWEPAGRDVFSYYSELRTDANLDTYAYSRLVDKLKGQQTSEDRETDRQANEEAIRLKENLIDSFNRVTEPQPMKGKRLEMLHRAMGSRLGHLFNRRVL